MHGSGRRGRRDTEGHNVHPTQGGFLSFFNVWDPREHPEKRQQPEGGAAGRHERCPELDAGGRRAGRKHGRPKVSADRVETCTATTSPPRCKCAETRIATPRDRVRNPPCGDTRMCRLEKKKTHGAAARRNTISSKCCRDHFKIQRRM